MCKPNDLARFKLPPTPPRSPVVCAAVVTDAEPDNAEGHHHVGRRNKRNRPRLHALSSSPLSPTSPSEADEEVLLPPSILKQGIETRRTKSWHYQQSRDRRGAAPLVETSHRCGFKSPDRLVTPATTPTPNQTEKVPVGLELELRLELGFAAEEHSALHAGERQEKEVSRSTLSPRSMGTGGGDTVPEEEAESSWASDMNPRAQEEVNGGFETAGTNGELHKVPRDTKMTDFVGEGSANVVVRIELPEDASAETKKFFQGKLLRLQKASDNPEKLPYPYPVQCQYWKDCVKPLFADKDDLVSHDLVYLGYDHDIIERADTLLAIMDHVTGGGSTETLRDDLKNKVSNLEGSAIRKRKKRFAGSRLARVEHAILVEDMKVDPNDGVLIEIKPKWLLQSPSAPENAVRCRNCAINLRRRLDDPSLARIKHPCPLLLTSDDWRERGRYMATILEEDELGQWYVGPLRKWFRGNTGSKPKRLLVHLRNLQERLDKTGPLGASADDEQFQLAMTLRDCSVFLRVLKMPDQPLPKVIAKLADLDKKNATAKMSYWRRTERELVQDKAYTAEYRVDYDSQTAEPVLTGCVLEQTRTRAVESVRIRCGKEEHNNLVESKGIDRYRAGVEDR